MTPEEWRRAMRAEAQAVQDDVWTQETVRAAEQPGVLGWIAPFMAAGLLAALALLLGPNLNPGGWGVHSNHLFRWYAHSGMLPALLFMVFMLTSGFVLARFTVRAWRIALVFAVFPLLVDLLGVVVYLPSEAVRSCVLDALRAGCVALDRQAQPIHPGAWNAGAAALSAFLAFAGASSAERWRGRP